MVISKNKRKKPMNSMAKILAEARKIGKRVNISPAEIKEFINEGRKL